MDKVLRPPQRPGAWRSIGSACARLTLQPMHAIGEGREHDSPTAQELRRYVSRGGEKLAGALAASDLRVAGRQALDIGASTGGFSDCLLQSGATSVIAVDVGYGQLDWRLRNDPRVHVLERTNARYLEPAQLPHVSDLAVIDVSFISLAKVLPAILRCLSERHDVLALIKPQFEAGRERVGKGGVVRRPSDRRDAIAAVIAAAQALGESLLGLYPSALRGPKGNRETFVWLAEGARAGAVRTPAAVGALIGSVEPDDELGGGPAGAGAAAAGQERARGR